MPLNTTLTLSQAFIFMSGSGNLPSSEINSNTDTVLLSNSSNDYASTTEYVAHPLKDLVR